MKTLKEIEEILNPAFDEGTLVKIVLMHGLGVEYDGQMKRISITYPKLEFGMPQHELCGLEVDCEYDGYREFETKDGYNFSVKLDEIEDCKEFPWLLYYWLYP